MINTENSIISHGIKPNKYRIAILDYLLKERNHPSPSVIFQFMKTQYPHISLATIYNTLQIFKEKGLVISFKGTDETEHYDADTGIHYHFLCENCGNITDIEAESGMNVELPESLQGSVIQRTSINLYGFCNQCHTKK